MGQKNRKTSQPSLDFTRKKPKLGKKPPLNPNLTVTTFKSKTLHVPGQSLGDNKENELTNHRNLTLKDLLTKMKHYSDTVRKEAVTGLRDLIRQHPVIVSMHTAAIMNRVVEVVNDTDRNVRTAVHNLIPHLLPLVDSVMMTPFIPLFTIYISAGMTHLRTTIRMDALHLFEMLMDHYPQQITQQCIQMLPNYMDLLKRVTISNSMTMTLLQANKAPNKAVSVKTLALNSRLLILRSMFKLIQLLVPTVDHSYANLMNRIESSASRAQQWTPGTTAVAIPPDFSSYIQHLSIPDLFTKNNITEGRVSTTLTTTSSSGGIKLLKRGTEDLNQQQKSDGGSTQADSSSSLPEVADIVQLKPTLLRSFEERLLMLQVIMPVLVDCWVEMAPTNMTISYSILEDQQLLLNILVRLLASLEDYEKLMAHHKEIANIRRDFEKYFVPRFPFVVGSPSNPDSREWIMSASLNSSITQIMTYFVSKQPAFINYQSSARVPPPPLPEWFNSYLDYIEDALEGGLVAEDKRMQQGQLVRSHISSMLWVVILTLPAMSKDRMSSILGSFIKFDEACHPNSTSKKSCVYFIKQLIDMNSILHFKDKVLKDIVQWGLASLPKLLWKLGNNDPSTSLMIINILASFGKDKTKKTQFESIQTALVPFFFTITKPNEKFPQGRQIFGPFVTLPKNVQIEAINLLYYFHQMGMLMIRSLIAICRSEKVSNDVLDILFDIVHCKRDEIGLGNYLAFSIAIVLSTTEQEKEEEKPQEDEEEQDKMDVVEIKPTTLKKSPKEKEMIMERICRNTNNLRPSITIIDLLNPISTTLVNQLTSSLENIKNNLLSLNYLLKFIYSTFDNRRNDEWEELPSELSEKKALPLVLSHYLYQTINSEPEYFGLGLKFIHLNGNGKLLLEIISILKEIMKKEKNIVGITSICIEIFKSKELLPVLQVVQKSMVEFVKSIKSQTLAPSEKSIVDRLVSECNIIYNINL
ncbi:hypothetical protein DFA_00927 [Cavenderia fasciculata]|uniref:Pre-rRNA-processing protein Ipi1 N-terminal domain-containing protein n=1 Tax=Cavenderia fasciculata TaxID=261658 RepID=F4PUI2_CACFS|nr:uncharacterized protein DFA_00927 [Cavenderia fasciculata]EGG21054.1 hypothetical protein DFA_00927 [Cavenderia fasciculata]|eukprot:XP_004358904.1 hypothetical protein DFA_00927 [Cavenderia fasciculata]